MQITADTPASTPAPVKAIAAPVLALLPSVLAPSYILPVVLESTGDAVETRGPPGIRDAATSPSSLRAPPAA